MFAIGVKGRNGKVFYVERFYRNQAITTSFKDDAMRFYSVVELKDKYHEVMGNDSMISYNECDDYPFVVRL